MSNKQTKRLKAWLEQAPPGVWGRWSKVMNAIGADSLGEVQMRAIGDDVRAIREAVGVSAARDALTDYGELSDVQVDGKEFGIYQTFMELADWSDAAFPTVVVEPRLAASLMMSDVPGELVPELGLPWPIFWCRCPTDDRLALHLGMKENRLRVNGVMFTDRGNGAIRLSMRAGPKNACVDHIDIAKLAELCDVESSNRSWSKAIAENAEYMSGKGVVGSPVPPGLASFCLGVILEMMSPAEPGEPGIGGRAVERKYKHGAPLACSFVLGRKVTIDCRDAVAALSRGDSGPLGSQHLRRGHWRNQPYGPGGKLRRPVHIEPTWVGPKGAPKLVREHALVRGAWRASQTTEAEKPTP